MKQVNENSDTFANVADELLRSLEVLTKIRKENAHNGLHRAHDTVVLRKHLLEALLLVNDL